MLERSVIQQRGFRNVVDNGAVTGFQLHLRNPNYRGISGSLVDGAEVVVDGQSYPAESSLWTFQGRTFTLAELRGSTDVRWPLDETAVVTVPRPGGLTPGTHRIEVAVHLRRPYIPEVAGPSVLRAATTGTIVPGPRPADGLKYGVSLYSYSGDLYTSMSLQDAMADIADLGATGIEILGEGNIPGYPRPGTEWIRAWHNLLDQYGLTPTNYGSWVDTAMWRDRDLTVQEGQAQLETDLRLAKELGFTSVRPKFGVVSADLEPHPIWRPAVERVLDLAADLDIVICPEIHSPTPIQHPVTQGYLDFIEDTGSKHFKLLIDTGIFQTAPVDDGHEGFEGKKRPPFLEPLAVPMADLVEVLPHVHFIQAKFFEIDDDLNDLHLPWRDIVATLRDAGWSGWLSSEYEGRREPYRGRDQVRRQHALLRSLTG
ncbi:MAG: sugar phosphate isomerase/epimerase [Streptomyces sp.]|nr:sugar phosphate isomerase/epimerase [Streptomyces sp.]